MLVLRVELLFLLLELRILFWKCWNQLDFTRSTNTFFQAQPFQKKKTKAKPNNQTQPVPKITKNRSFQPKQTDCFSNFQTQLVPTFPKKQKTIAIPVVGITIRLVILKPFFKPNLLQKKTKAKENHQTQPIPKIEKKRFQRKQIDCSPNFQIQLVPTFPKK